MDGAIRRREQIIREIMAVKRKMETSVALLSNQYIAFISPDYGSKNARVKGRPTPAATVAIPRLGVLTSVDAKTRQSTNHSSTIRSIKGCNCNGSGCLGVLLSDGKFFTMDGLTGNWNRMRRFESLNGVKVKKLSTGSNHFLMLSEDGRVFSMLTNESPNEGQLGTGNTSMHYEPVEITGIPKIRKIQAGLKSTLLIEAGGYLRVCGPGGGRFPFQGNFKKPTRIIPNVRKAFSGFNSETTFIQKTTGQVLAGGDNYFGQCGVGFTEPNGWNLAKWTEIQFEDGNPFERADLVKISCSGYATFLLLSDGTLFSCGREVENGFDEQKTKFTELKTFSERNEKVLDFACGRNISVFLADSGKIYMTAFRNMDHSYLAFEYLGKEIEGAPGECLLKVVTRKDQNRKSLKNAISKVQKFKISLWSGILPKIIVTEKDDESILESQLKILKKSLKEKIESLTADFNAATISENEMLREKVEKVAKSAENRGVLALIESLDAFISPLSSVQDLENFVSFFCSGEEALEKTLELYKADSDRTPRGGMGFEPAVVEKITKILKGYKTLRESETSKEYFEYFRSGPQSSIQLESLDRVYRDFFTCLDVIRKNGGHSVNTRVLLDSIFRYFRFLDFDLDMLISFVASLEKSLNKTLSEVEKAISVQSEVLESKIPKDHSDGDDPIEEYLKSFGDDVTFFRKFSFLVLKVLTAFIGSLLRELSNPDTYTQLDETIRWVRKVNYKGYKTADFVGDHYDKYSDQTLFESLRSIHAEISRLYSGIAGVKEMSEKGRYLRRIGRMRLDLRDALVALLRFRIRSDNASADEVSDELLSVFRQLGICQDDRSDALDALKGEFDMSIERLMLKISAGPRGAPVVERFVVLGYDNSDVKKTFYEADGTLKKKYKSVPKIVYHNGKPLSLFVKFYVRDKVDRIQAKFVHLFSGEAFGNGCEHGVPVKVLALREPNSFEVAVPNLGYFGEFGLSVTAYLHHPLASPQEFFHRGIYSVFP